MNFTRTEDIVISMPKYW